MRTSRFFHHVGQISMLVVASSCGVHERSLERMTPDTGGGSAGHATHSESGSGGSSIGARKDGTGGAIVLAGSSTSGTSGGITQGTTSNAEGTANVGGLSATSIPTSSAGGTSSDTRETTFADETGGMTTTFLGAAGAVDHTGVNLGDGGATVVVNGTGGLLQTTAFGNGGKAPGGASSVSFAGSSAAGSAGKGGVGGLPNTSAAGAGGIGGLPNTSAAGVGGIGGLPNTSAAGVGGVPTPAPPSCIEASVNPGCGDCLLTSCHDAYVGCHASSDCEALLSCIGECGGGLSCHTNCQATYSNSVPLAEALFECTDVACATQCGPLGTAITGYAQAFCQKMRECAPGQLAILYDGYDDCVMRTRMHKTWVSCLPNNNGSETRYGECATAWTSRTCADYFAPDPDACWQSGVLENGRPCNANEQCESTFCKQEAWSCGICAASPSNGADCNDWRDCSRDQWCTPTGTCELPRALSRSCSDDYAPCRNDLMCSSGTCIPAPDALGANCNVFAGVDCKYTSNLRCSYSTNQCIAMTIANTGEDCGHIGNTYAMCGDLGNCITGHCKAHPADHAACNAAAESCEWPAVCSISGTCMLPMDREICK